MDKAEQPDIEIIHTLADFMAWIEQLCPKDASQSKPVCFYRGHADLSWLLLPGVYRPDGENKSFRSDESRLYHEMLRLDQAAFAEDKTPLERLARMQHYGLPTRLLDISESPLVALFFACWCEPKSDESKRDGQVIAFPLPNRRYILLQDELPPTSLAGMEKNLDLSQLDKQIINAFYNYLSDEKRLMGASLSGYPQLEATFRQALDEVETLRSNILQCTDPFEGFGYFHNLVEAIRHLVENINEGLRQEEKSSTNQDNLTARLFLVEMLTRLSKWEIKTKKSLCEQMAIPEQGKQQGLADFLNSLTQFHFIAPPLNSMRIRQQAGAFIIFPPVASNVWTLEKACQSMGSKIARASIPNGVKPGLLAELANIGITQSYLFPELEKRANYIKSIYPPTPDKFL